MKAWTAILYTVAIYGVSYVASRLISYDLTWIVILGTAGWVALDSAKIQIKRYQSGISYGPGVLFIACVLLWAVTLPWYLVVRSKIKNRTALLKE